MLFGGLCIHAAANAELRNGDQHHNHCQEQSAGPHGTHAKAAINFGLGQQVTECCSEGASQDVANPKSQYGVTA